MCFELQWNSKAFSLSLEKVHVSVPSSLNCPLFSNKGWEQRGQSPPSQRDVNPRILPWPPCFFWQMWRYVAGRKKRSPVPLREVRWGESAFAWIPNMSFTMKVQSFNCGRLSMMPVGFERQMQVFRRSGAGMVADLTYWVFTLCGFKWYKLWSTYHSFVVALTINTQISESCYHFLKFAARPSDVSSQQNLCVTSPPTPESVCCMHD